MRSQNRVCLDAADKACEVSFPAIWEPFLAMVALRLESVGLT